MPRGIRTPDETKFVKPNQTGGVATRSSVAQRIGLTDVATVISHQAAAKLTGNVIAGRIRGRNDVVVATNQTTTSTEGIIVMARTMGLRMGNHAIVFTNQTTTEITLAAARAARHRMGNHAIVFTNQTTTEITAAIARTARLRMGNHTIVFTNQTTTEITTAVTRATRLRMGNHAIVFTNQTTALVTTQARACRSSMADLARARPH